MSDDIDLFTDHQYESIDFIAIDNFSRQTFQYVSDILNGSGWSGRVVSCWSDNHVGGGIIETVRDRVAFILNRYAEARNSDIELVWLYCELIESEKFPGDYITKEHKPITAR